MALVADLTFGPSWLDDAAGLMIIVFCLVSFLAVSVPALTALGYGLDGPATSLFGFITCEVTPPGTAQVKQRRPRDDADARKLAHSSLYGDPEVIEWAAIHVLGTNEHKPESVP